MKLSFLAEASEDARVRDACPDFGAEHGHHAPGAPHEGHLGAAGRLLRVLRLLRCPSRAICWSHPRPFMCEHMNI